ncbi:MAG: hypothetical protein BWY66_00857 [bacterium ADurb.Bin374]|nr:MAG: hypothetical protein BWY66_00857 [bacterium ADurb.Bin374]
MARRRPRDRRAEPEKRLPRSRHRPGNGPGNHLHEAAEALGGKGGKKEIEGQGTKKISRGPDGTGFPGSFRKRTGRRASSRDAAARRVAYRRRTCSCPGFRGERRVQAAEIQPEGRDQRPLFRPVGGPQPRQSRLSEDASEPRHFPDSPDRRPRRTPRYHRRRSERLAVVSVRALSALVDSRHHQTDDAVSRIVVPRRRSPRTERRLAAHRVDRVPQDRRIARSRRLRPARHDHRRAVLRLVRDVRRPAPDLLADHRLLPVHLRSHRRLAELRGACRADEQPVSVVESLSERPGLPGVDHLRPLRRRRLHPDRQPAPAHRTELRTLVHGDLRPCDVLGAVGETASRMPPRPGPSVRVRVGGAVVSRRGAQA